MAANESTRTPGGAANAANGKHADTPRTVFTP